MQKFYCNHQWFLLFLSSVALSNSKITTNNNSTIIKQEGKRIIERLRDFKPYFSEVIVAGNQLPEAKKQVLPPPVKNEMLKNWDVQLIFHDPFQHHPTISKDNTIVSNSKLPK